MTPAEIRESVVDILSDIAPDQDLSDLKPERLEVGAFREGCLKLCEGPDQSRQVLRAIPLQAVG